MGGQSIPNFDYGMAIGVNKSFRKAIIQKLLDYLNIIAGIEYQSLKTEIKASVDHYIANGVKLDEYVAEENMSKDSSRIMAIVNIISNYTNTDISLDIASNILKSAIRAVVDETHQAMEAVIHNLNSMHSRAGAQVPFSSLNYGTDTTDAGRLVIRETLNAVNEGLGNGETAIFPISIFRVKDGVNFKPGDPNYDLYKYSMEVTAKRLFPNYLFLDAPFNLQYYVEGRPETYVATMGCVSGKEFITYILDGMQFYETFEAAACRIGNTFDINTQGASMYSDTSGYVSIYDTNAGRFVDCKRFIVNPMTGKYWRKITTSSGHVITVTNDHPLPVFGRGRVYAENINTDDSIAVIITHTDKPSIAWSKVCDIVDMNPVEDELCYDVETETDHFDVSGIWSHNCRTRVMGNVNGPEISHGRGNLSFSTINLPRLAIEAKGDIDTFFEGLSKMLKLVEDQLYLRYKYQSTKKVLNFPFLMGEALWLDSDKLDYHDSVKEVLKHGTLSIGFIGLAEALVALIGKHHGESKEAQELGLKIVGYIRKWCDDASQRHQLNYSLLATPSEGLSGRFTRLDKKRYGIIPGVTDRLYYTNSCMVPVYYEISAFDKIAIEAPYHALCNAGHIAYIEMDGDPSKNVDAIEQILAHMKNCGIGYGSINHPVDYDPVCGYTGNIDDVCPRCGRREGEPVAVDKLRHLGVWKHHAADPIAYRPDPNEEANRVPNIFVYTPKKENE